MATGLTDEQIVKAGRQHGSKQYAADALGLPRSTFRDQIRSRGLTARWNVAVAEYEAVQREKRAKDPASVIEDRTARRLREQDAEIRSLRRDRDKLADKVVDQEGLFERMVEAARIPVEVPRYKVQRQNKGKPARSVVAPIYDQQFGQHVATSDTPGNRGGFNVPIFDKRLARWVEGVTGNIRDYAASHRIEELILPFGGDQVEGDEIFPGQAWQLELNPMEQAVELATKMESAVRTVVQFAKEEIGVPWVSVYGVTGNHGKVGGKKSGARPATYDWDWLFLTLLFDKLRGEPINEKVIEPGGSVFFFAAGHEFQAIHGDEIKGWGGLPFYGLTRFDGRSIRLHNVIYRYLLMGHHHQTAEVPNGPGETIVSGDWVGPNNLTRQHQGSSRPQQKVLYVAPKWGVTETAKIYFSEADEAYRPTKVYGQVA